MGKDERLPTGRGHLTEARLSEPGDLKEGGGCASLTIEQILAWAEAHHTAHGAWPAVGPETLSGDVSGAPGESWKAINHALCFGLRGLPGDSSLAELLAEHRGVPLPDMGPKALADKIWAWEQEQFPVNRPRRGQTAKPSCPPLSLDQIRAWAEAHYAATGQWPRDRSGPVRDAPFEVTWSAIDSALLRGSRGLPRGLSLVRLLGAQPDPRPPLTAERIVAWADAHHAATGNWPASNSGKVAAAPGECWSTIATALRTGGRGLPGGQTIAGLLAEHRGVRNGQARRNLSGAQIVAWADAYHAAHGRWPGYLSGTVAEAPDLTWCVIAQALQKGKRGLPGGMSLGDLIKEHRGPAASNSPPPLRLEQVLEWAAAHHAATGKWPGQDSGPVREAPFPLTWKAVDMAFRKGLRGLPRGLLLAALSPDYGKIRPPLSIAQILAWADAHHAAHGHWPTQRSGEIPGTGGERWAAIDHCLCYGKRGLSGGQSLGRVFHEHRGMRHPQFLPALTVEQILGWADAYHETYGVWPQDRSGPVAGAPGETWYAIDGALRYGKRGLAAGVTLARLLAEHRGPRPAGEAPALCLEQVLAWADAYRAARGCWPTMRSGPIPGASGESWKTVTRALRQGARGLPVALSIAGLLRAHRPDKPRLTLETVRAWAEAHQRATGLWPTAGSGAVAGVTGESWGKINEALSLGKRGLPGGTSLARLLEGAARRQIAWPRAKLTVAQILDWARAHHAATGRWPRPSSGAIAGAPGEHWRSIAYALLHGSRGLPGGMNLATLIARHLDPAAETARPKLTIDQVLGWADAYLAVHGRWPPASAGTIPGAPGETWRRIEDALRHGCRGLPEGLSLRKLWLKYRQSNPA
jgi:hypothetical protein